MPDLLATLNEAKRQYLEAKRRYVMVRELVRIRHILRLREESRHSSPCGDSTLSLRSQELNDSALRLQKLKDLIHLREICLRRQQRAHRLRDKAEAAQRRRQDPELMENLRMLRKLKELVRHQERILHRQNRALAQRDYAVTAQCSAAHDQAGNSLQKQPAGPQPKPASIEKPIESQERGSCKVSCRTNNWRKHRSRSHAGSLVRLRELRRHQENLQGDRQQGSQARRCPPRVRWLAIQDLTVRGPPLPHSTVLTTYLLTLRSPAAFLIRHISGF